MLSIIPFEDRYTQDVIDLVLHFQNDGTRPPVSVDDQPDLLHITESYMQKGGYFWIATDDGRLAGTIGIMPYTDEVAALKKFFGSRIKAHRTISDSSCMPGCCSSPGSITFRRCCWIPPATRCALTVFMKKRDFKR